MNVLCVSDLHVEEECLKYLAAFIAKHAPDLVLVAGDFTDFGPVSFAEEVLDSIEAPVLAVAGNCDPKAVSELLEERGVSLHLRKRDFGGFSFVGFDGSITCPTKTPNEHADEEFLQLRGLVESNTILLTHQPPFNTKADVVSSGLHVGSRALRKVIEEKQPLACVCGHIHEAKGIDAIGATKILKVEPLMRGKALLLELPSLKATELQTQSH